MQYKALRVQNLRRTCEDFFTSNTSLIFLSKKFSENQKLDNVVYNMRAGG